MKNNKKSGLIISFIISIIGIVLLILAVSTIGNDFSIALVMIGIPLGFPMAICGITYFVTHLLEPYTKKKKLEMAKEMNNELNILPNVIYCPNCNSTNSKDDKFCKKCGQPLYKTCPHCGSEIENDNKFCGKCGGSL